MLLLAPDFFSKLAFLKRIFQESYNVAYQTSWIQASPNVGPDLDPNYL